MRVKVSVIMSVFDPHPFSQFEKAVESVMSQTLKEWELLISVSYTHLTLPTIA